MRGFYNICPKCGAHLDFGEKCDCEDNDNEILRKTLIQHDGVVQQPDYPNAAAEFFAAGIENIDNEAAIICIEECSELQKELSKRIRGYNNRDALIEELADVYITICNVRRKYRINVDEMQHFIDAKIGRHQDSIFAFVRSKDVML